MCSERFVNTRLVRLSLPAIDLTVEEFVVPAYIREKLVALQPSAYR